MVKDIEKGSLFYFYRPKIGAGKLSSIDDIQRLYMIMKPDRGRSRLFVVGKKHMPSFNKTTSSEAKEWMVNITSSKSSKDILHELHPIEYTTETRGKRRQESAVPVGQGRYKIILHQDHTELVQKLSDVQGKAQKELGLEPEAGYIISVKNPKIKVPGFSDKQADYPNNLQSQFGDKRWIDVTDPRLIEYEDSQLLLIGARKSLEGITKIQGQADISKELGLDKARWNLDALHKGKLVPGSQDMYAKSPRGNLSKGGKRGGKSALESASAAGVAKALKGITLPKKKDGLLDYAKDNGADDPVIEVLQDLPERRFDTMADVEKALGGVR